jgi:serine/threonine-protein kinase
VSDLDAKSYLVAVTAEGFERTAPQAVIVKGGEDAVHNVTLQAPLVVAPTGLDIPASAPGLELSVDGRIHGTLPQRVLDLTPGEHVLRVSGGDRYRDQEKTVNVIEGQVLSLQPFALEVKRGRAIIEAGSNADDAVVKLDGRTIRLPHAVDLDASKKHTITATREGYETFEQEVTFEAGKAERTFIVALAPSETPSEEVEAEAQESVSSARASSASRGSSSSRKSVVSRSPSGSSAGKGTLNITSTPSAMVILDGRPIGKTPRMGVKVSPGAHSIVFVSDKGRKRATTKVAAGASKTVSVRF